MFTDLPTSIPTRVATVTLNPAIDHTFAVSNFTIDAVNRAGSAGQSDPGGKGVNVASFLSDFGISVSVTGFLGQENADVFQTFFYRKGIRNRFVPIPGKTRTNLKIIDEAQDQVTDINFPGQRPTAEDVETLYRTIDELAVDHDWFVLAGSVPKNMSMDIYADLTNRLKAQGKTVIVDASGESLLKTIPATPYAIKPNVAELQEALGRSLPNTDAVVEAAQDLLRQGVHSVVISMGAQGAIFVEADRALWARPPRVDVVSTVGAGDAMVTGLIVGKLRGFSLDDCARLATACSVGALSQIGPYLPPLSEVESIAHQVTIDSVMLTALNAT